MKEKNIEGTVESRVCFQELEDWVREKVHFINQEPPCVNRCVAGGEYPSGLT